MIRASDVSRLDTEAIRSAVAGFSPAQIASIANSWEFWSREEQRPPDGDWTTWLFLGGRGTGKTRSGAEYVKDLALSYPGIRMAMIAPTARDVRETMLYGVSGLMSLHWTNDTRPRHASTSKGSGLFWANGSRAIPFTAEEPDRLRGPNFHVAWCDELASWRYIEDCWDMLQFSLRLEYPGFATPRIYISTTPRPLALLRSLLKDPSTVVTRGTTYDNKPNLSRKFFDTIIEKYRGSTLGRQEIYGELIDDLTGALWRRIDIDLHRVRGRCPRLSQLILAVDPAASDKTTANECGIIAVGRGYDDDRGYVVGDFTTHAKSPAIWGKKVCDAFRTLGCNYVVAEGNLGGGLVEAVLKQIDPTIPVKFVQAKRGKYLRAEPVAMLYEQGKVSHVGHFPLLEDQMCRFTAQYEKDNPGLSPDRVDALVWGVAILLLQSYYDSSMKWVG